MLPFVLYFIVCFKSNTLATRIMEEFGEIRDIIETVLGEPKRSYAGNGGWFEYNCPNCADENCGIPDDKYNLALNYENGSYCHCWKCGWSGKLSKLLKRYGNQSLLARYRDEIQRIVNAHYYEIESGNLQVEQSVLQNDELKLPEGISDLYDGSDEANRALEYLHGRGVGDDIIKRFSIGYVGNYYVSGTDRYTHMVIIPSYDSFGELNYFTGRDYTGRTFMNKKNPNISKKDIVFNEGRINWYEPITLVEGPFDHIVVPNSIPLLGKSIGMDYAVYKAICERSKSYINIMLDNDAENDMYKIYAFLNGGQLRGKIRAIEMPNGYDPSDIYRDYGKRGILKLLASAKEINDYTLLLNE